MNSNVHNHRNNTAIRPLRSHRRQGGLTLPEMMIVLAISMLLLRIAVPSYESLVNNERLTAVSNELAGAIHLARSEAVKQAANVSICAANTALTACANTAVWNNGWLVVAADGEVLWRRSALETIFSMQDAGTALTAGTITFNAMGFTAVDRAVQVCGPNNKAALAKALRVTRSGDIRLAGDANGNGVLEPLSGGNELVCSA